jgi:hypothetical protein
MPYHLYYVSLYGVVIRLKDKNVLLYRANKKGTMKIAELINGKLRTDKIDNFNNNILSYTNKWLDTPLSFHDKDTSMLTRGY